MKIQLFASVFAISSLTIATTFIGSHPASAGSTTFVCGTSQGVPATMARTPRGDVPVIRWVSSYFSGSGWTPERRCQEVSQRFESYNQTGALNYLTTGEENNLPVICVTDRKGGSCHGTLFTLKNGSNPDATLQNLLNVRIRASGPLRESKQSRAYIDMNDFLKTAPLEVGNSKTPSIQPPAISPKAAPTPSQSGNSIW